MQEHVPYSVHAFTFQTQSLRRNIPLLHPPLHREGKNAAQPKTFPLLWKRCHDEDVTDEEHTQKSGTLFADELFCGRELCMRL